MRVLPILLIHLATYGLAQQVDYNSIILPGSAKDLDFSEVLVRLAWQNNPSNKVLKSRLTISEIELKQAQWKWLEQIQVTGNLNEFNLNPDLNQNLFFPRYNISAYIRLSNFVDSPQEAKKMRQETIIAEQNINSQKLALRAEVLRLYQTFLTEQEMLRIQGENFTNMQSMYNLAEQKFSKGEITLDEYNSLADRNNAEKMKMVSYQSNFNIAKINLEELIGVRLEDVLK